MNYSLHDEPQSLSNILLLPLYNFVSHSYSLFTQYCDPKLAFKVRRTEALERNWNDFQSRMSVEERKENLFQFSKEFELFVRYGLYKHRYGLSTLTTIWGRECLERFSSLTLETFRLTAPPAAVLLNDKISWDTFADFLREGAQHPVLHVSDFKKTGSRSARTRSAARTY